MPLTLILRWLFGILGLVVLAAAAYLLYSWFDGVLLRDAAGGVRVARGAPWRLWTGIALLAWSFLGRFPTLLLFPKGKDEPRVQRGAGSVVEGPAGSKIWVESHGPAGAPLIVFTHGWGMNATIWWYAKKHLAGQFRLVLWDLPGLGRSKAFSDGKISLNRYAECLKAVVTQTGDTSAVLVGHSIGGMITQTLARDHPEFVQARASGLVLIDTTYINPLRTMILSGLFQAIRIPVIFPLLWMQILLSPLVWLMNWKSYLDGTMLLITRMTGFGPFSTRGQLDMTSLLSVKGSPGVQAKGDLAMIGWDATGSLTTVAVPVLILSGDKDIITLPRASSELATQAEDVRLLSIDRCGHMGFFERADRFNEAIAKFVADVDASTD